MIANAKLAAVPEEVTRRQPRREGRDAAAGPTCAMK